jgi:hypothetical protein
VLKRTKQNDKLIRFLFIKLANAVDTTKQVFLFNLLVELLPSNCSLVCAVIQDTIKLKWSRRVTPDLAKFFLKWCHRQMTKELTIPEQILIG